MQNTTIRSLVAGLLTGALAITGCGEDGDDGAPGAPGADGDDGAPGMNGRDGTDGSDGRDGADGADGADGQDGAPGLDSLAGLPLSATVALTLSDTAVAELEAAGAPNPTSVGAFVRRRVQQYADGNLPDGVQFPLLNAFTDTVRTTPGIESQVVIRWLDPMVDAPDPVTGPRWGDNNDFLAYFGDGFDGNPDNGGPQVEGSDEAGWLWSNFEYVSSAFRVRVGSAPASSTQALTMAISMQNRGLFDSVFELTDDTAWTQEVIDAYVAEWRRNIGGGWVRLVQDPGTRNWDVDQRANNVRYDSTSATQVRITGRDFSGRTFTTEDGTALPQNVVPGIMADCSGGVSPWGTVVTAEENAQGYFGDFEFGYSSQFLDTTRTDIPFTPGSTVDFTFDADPDSDYGQHSDPNFRPDRDAFGYLVEIDPGVAPDAAYDAASGEGHQKIGALGRARWENTAFVTNDEFGLIDGQPIVMYAGNDRRGGRVYKFATSDNYEAGMTKAQIRNLLSEGTVWVAHFADMDNDSGFTLDDGVIGSTDLDLIPTEDNRGNGRWVELGIGSMDTPPNQATAPGGTGSQTVGEALQDNDYNNIAGFADDEDVFRALYTVSNKLGVMETDRPEDVEWNPLDPSGTPRLYIAFTNNGDDTTLNHDGTLSTIRGVDDSCAGAATDPCARRFRNRGNIMVLEEANPSDPSLSTTFTFFSVGNGDNNADPEFSWADVDNIMIDPNGGIWFGTDGNPGDNGQADGLYFLDRDESRRGTPSFGRPFRIVGGPSNSEATGPATTPGMGTIFFNVQHPGEGSSVDSAWPPAR
jgi:hypothetical protein